MALESIYYRHSGRFNPVAPIVLFLGCGLCSVVAGVAYGIGIYYCPSIFLSVFLPLIVGLGLGGLVYLSCKWMHIRNLTMALAAGLVCGLLLEYSAFVSWVLVVSGWNTLILWPRELMYVLGQIAEVGVWQVIGIDFMGAMLYVVWVIELIVILASAMTLAFFMLKELVYCERCGTWATGHKSVKPFEPIENPGEFRKQLERCDYTALGSLAVVSHSAEKYTIYDLAHCTRCNDLYLLSVGLMTITKGSDGKPQKLKTKVVQNLLIDAESHQLIQQLKSAGNIEDGGTQTPGELNLGPQEAPGVSADEVDETTNL